MNIVYLDWAATAIPDKEIITKSAETALIYFGNPSSSHIQGTRAREFLEEQRSRLAVLFSCKKEHLIFTSGGSESNNMVLRSLLFRKKRPSLVITGIEHASVYETARLLQQEGCELRIPPTGKDGFVGIEQICDLVDETTVLVSIIHVSNETGAVQPVKEIVEGIRRKSKSMGRRIHIHTDAVQSAGKLPLVLDEMGVDSASMSSHKFCGPMGIGLLYLKSPIPPLLSGGEQEFSLRAGTENTAGAAGMTLALEKRVTNMDREYRHAASLKHIILDHLLPMEGVKLIESGDKEYSPYILTAMFPPVPAEVLVRVLSDRGFAVSNGSACSTKKSKKNRVMEEMGVPLEEASSSIRISFGPVTTSDDAERFCETLKDSVESLKHVALL